MVVVGAKGACKPALLGVAAAPGAVAPEVMGSAGVPPASTPAPVDYSLGAGATPSNAGLQAPLAPTTTTAAAQPLTASVAPQTQAEMLKQAAVAGAKTTGQYMMYAEGVKLLAGGITGAVAAKDTADAREIANRQNVNRNYQPNYNSTTSYQGPLSDRPREQFSPDGMLTSVRA